MIVLEVVSVVLLVLIGLAVLTVAVYLNVKLAAYGWHRGRQLFFDDQKRQEASDGEEEREEAGAQGAAKGRFR